MLEQLNAMKNMDIQNIDPSSVVDIRDVSIDTSLPKEERMLDFIRQIGNPYCYKCGDIIVKVSHAQTNATLDERLEHHLQSL